MRSGKSPLPVNDGYFYSINKIGFNELKFNWSSPAHSSGTNLMLVSYLTKCSSILKTSLINKTIIVFGTNLSHICKLQLKTVWLRSVNYNIRGYDLYL